MRNKIIIAWWIVLIIALLISFGFWLGDRADAELNDETLKQVDDLRTKHYNYSKLYYLQSEGDINIEWNRDYLSIWIEDGKPFVETQDGKWFIEMEKIKEEDN
jgi:hypothetical protein